MTARDVIAMEVSAECNTVDWERGRTDSEDVADAILAALDAAGFQVVPREPTADMLIAGNVAIVQKPLFATEIYKAMLAAAANEAAIRSAAGGE